MVVAVWFQNKGQPVTASQDYIDLREIFPPERAKTTNYIFIALTSGCIIQHLRKEHKVIVHTIPLYTMSTSFENAC
jgi:hypothetical protein